METTKFIQLNEAKWDRWAAVADGKGFKYDYLRKAQSKVVALLGLKENMNFLDIGCGTGWAIGQAAKAVDYKGSFYGVDMSTKMIEKAKDNFKDKENFHFIKANSESIPLDNDMFDFIICTNSFHHYLHPDKAMNEIHRLLKANGKIYILDPTADHWAIKLFDIIVKTFKHDHVKIYSSKEFKDLIIGSGLKYVGCEKFNAHQKVHIGEK